MPPIAPEQITVQPAGVERLPVFTPREFRDAMGQFATGVVIEPHPGQRSHGLQAELPKGRTHCAEEEGFGRLPLDHKTHDLQIGPLLQIRPDGEIIHPAQRREPEDHCGTGSAPLVRQRIAPACRVSRRRDREAAGGGSLNRQAIPGPLIG